METGNHGRNDQAKKHVALALSGGGFKSVADQSGIIAGLLAVLMKQSSDLQKNVSPLASSELLGNVLTITSISGGSWFASSLAYSESFRIMIEDLARAAASNKESSGIFNTRYSKRFNDLAKGADVDKGPEFLAKTKKALSFLHNGAIPEAMEFGLLMTAFLYQQNEQHVSWSSFVSHILMDDIGETMGSSVQEWAVGKALAIVTSVISPIPARMLTKSPFDRDYIWYKSDGNNVLNMFESNCLFYNMEQPKESQATLIPARFSVILGAAKSTPAPLPYGPSVLDGIHVNYKGSNSSDDNWNLPQKFNATSDLGIAASLNDRESFYDTPISGPVAASSSVIGILTMIRIIAKLFDNIQLDPGVWFASNLAGREAFEEPLTLTRRLWKEKKLTQGMVDQASSIGMYELTDGGATDAFGIATALAAGATDIFVINSMSSGFSIACHFSGFQYAQFGLFGSVSKVLHNSRWPIDVWKVFMEDQRFYNKEARKFNTLEIKHVMENATQSTSYLAKISFGSMEVTTAENKYFGIEGGRPVNLHVFLAIGNVSVGFNQMFDDYGFYVQDIITTLTSDVNKDIVNKMLDALLVGKCTEIPDYTMNSTK